MKRRYEVDLAAVVTVDDTTKEVVVEIPLTGLASQLEFDYAYPNPDKHTTWHAEIINDYLLESLEHHTLTHRMEEGS